MTQRNSNATILIVEDDQIDLDDLPLSLREHGIGNQVAVAYDGFVASATYGS